MFFAVAKLFGFSLVMLIISNLLWL